MSKDKRLKDCNIGDIVLIRIDQNNWEKSPAEIVSKPSPVVCVYYKDGYRLSQQLDENTECHLLKEISNEGIKESKSSSTPIDLSSEESFVFKIPENSKEVLVNKVDDKIVISFPYKKESLKSGDVFTGKDVKNTILIIRPINIQIDVYYIAEVYDGYFRIYVSYINNCLYNVATDDEKAAFFARVTEEGYRYDSLLERLVKTSETFQAKKGDFITFDNTIGIVENTTKASSGNATVTLVCHFDTESQKLHLIPTTFAESQYMKLATDDEKKILLETIHDAGRKYNAEESRLDYVKYDPKNGDVVVVNDNTIIIYKAVDLHTRYTVNYCYFSTKTNVFSCSGVFPYECKSIRKATEKEKQLLFDKLEENELQWNAQELKLEKIQWKPIVGQTYWTFSCDGVFGHKWINSYLGNIRLERGFVFKTKHEARDFFNKIVEIVKNR